MSEELVGSPIDEKVRSYKEFLLDRPWWEQVVRGILIVMFGVLAITYPGMTAAVLVIFFGAFVFIEGIFQMVGSFSAKAENRMWALMFINGLFSFLIGVLVLAYPASGALVLIIFIGAWALVNGVTQMVIGLRSTEAGARRGLTILGGVIGIAFGMMCIAWPGATAISLIWIIGVLAIFFGLQLMVLGFMSRTGERSTSAPAAA